jgi:hypothetical protein
MEELISSTTSTTKGYYYKTSNVGIYRAVVLLGVSEVPG